MATLPWTEVQRPADERAEVLVLASRLELRAHRTIPSFMRAAIRLRRQVRQSDGAFGMALSARPAHKTFWTLSAWRDEGSMEAFVATPAHRAVMHRFHADLADATFVTFRVPGADLPAVRGNARRLWRDAMARLGESEHVGTTTTEGAR
jgi:quinol monooxygenase YgiN